MLLQIMELVYVILEAGYTIKELIVLRNTLEIEIYMYIDTVKISTRLKYFITDNDSIYNMLDEMKLISKSDIDKYRDMFVTSNTTANANTTNTNSNNEQSSFDPAKSGEVKNVAIMKFVLGAMSSGWKVRKSIGRRQYTFNKTHHYHKKYFNGSFLSKFLKKNALR
jgi:hypothetical protein